jgi:hypothetical protein
MKGAGIIIVVLFVLAIVVSAFVPPAKYQTVLNAAYKDAPQPYASQWAIHGANLIPASLRTTRALADPNGTTALHWHFERLKSFARQLILELVLLLPLRLLALAPYLLAALILCIAIYARSMVLTRTEEFRLQMDVSGSLTPAPRPLAWRAFALGAAFIAIALPVPLPIAFAGALLLTATGSPAFKKPVRQVPEPT